MEDLKKHPAQYQLLEAPRLFGHLKMFIYFQHFLCLLGDARPYIIGRVRGFIGAGPNENASESNDATIKLASDYGSNSSRRIRVEWVDKRLDTRLSESL
jgi:hypothetical protein